MKRRSFIEKSLYLSASMCFTTGCLQSRSNKDLILGHGDFRYKVDLGWGNLDKIKHPVSDCHEMVQDSKGRIFLLTNNVKNNIIIYDKGGKLLETWGTSYPGAHGLTLKNEGGEDFLYITDTVRNQVIKTDLKGREILILDFPKETEVYKSKGEYLPTETAIAENGDIYIADGYGKQYILVYDQKGRLKHFFGGKGSEDSNFSNAHGIAIDNRYSEPRLLITDRMVNQLKHFSLAGDHIANIDLPGAFICRPVIKGDHVYLATIWSYEGHENTGFVSILNEQNQLISAPGGCKPIYENGTLDKVYQTVQVFKHPHDVCVDNDDNLYVPQWNAGQVYPIKLLRV